MISPSCFAQAARDNGELHSVLLYKRIARASGWAGECAISPTCFAKGTRLDSASYSVLSCKRIARADVRRSAAAVFDVGVVVRCRFTRQVVHTVRLAGVAFAPIVVRPGFVPMGLVGWCPAAFGVLPFVEVASVPPGTERYVPFAVPSTCHEPYSHVLLYSLVAFQGGAIAQTGLAMTSALAFNLASLPVCPTAAAH